LLADRVVVLSPRPARVERIVPVKRPRPRGHAFVASPEFAALRRELLDALGLLA
jgi:NitT/TauT family transport system ATP-binding protein